MKIYVAAVYTSSFGLSAPTFNRLTEAEQKHRLEVQYYLESYHYIHKQSVVDKIERDNIKVFLDSGAFSAFTKGIEVDLPGYCEYIKRNSHIILHEDGQPLASVLDGIGDPLKTWNNQQEMEHRGVRPLPCFHYGEDERYLEHYLENYPYITIGGMVPIAKPQLKLWLDRIWEKYLTDEQGRSRVKVHGFGLTTRSLIDRYPWYSVDSSAWVQLASSGGLLNVDHKNTMISSSSPSRKSENQHVDTFSPAEREAFEAYVRGRGFEPDRLRQEYLARWVYNLATFTELNRRYAAQDRTFKYEQPELFG